MAGRVQNGGPALVRFYRFLCQETDQCSVSPSLGHLQVSSKHIILHFSKSEKNLFTAQANPQVTLSRKFSVVTVGPSQGLNRNTAGQHWHTLRQLLPLYQAITTVSIGDGKNSFWNDVWFGNDALADAFPALYSHCSLKNVSVHDTVHVGISNTLVPPLSQAALNGLQVVQDILAATALTTSSDKRKPIFSRGDSGLDTATICRLIKVRGQPDDPKAQFIWKSSAPPRLQMFMWLLTQGRIQCRLVLHRKHVVDNPICEICHSEDESAEHLVSRCTLAANFWSRIGLTDMLNTQVQHMHNTTPSGGVPREEFSTFMAICCWQLWKARNAKIFRNEPTTLAQFLSSRKSAAEQWKIRIPRKKKNVIERWHLIFEMARQGES